ncbi:MAG TPA: hypothetical protein DD979_14350, partial [Gammaproteobacteria bacterium]|nr:hypothetical protein [Gammaproteobacteria bacterium]
MSTLPKQAIREASAWLVELNSGEATEGDQQRWQQWYQHSPENQAAWDKIEQFRHQLQGAPAAAVHRAVDGADRVLLQRRALLKSLLALAIIPPAAYTGYRHSPWYADYQTAHGELAAHTLTDGTELMLNTHTAVDIRYASDQRTLFLRHGEILVTTAKPAGESRPFHVQTAHGTVRALGTRFSVYTDRNTSRVDVYEH